VHTGNTIIINAPRKRIYEIVSDLERWPERLPHYRYVRTLRKEGMRDIVAMSARRGIIPISWVSAYEADSETMELRFEHLKKWTKGMIVIWNLTPTRDATRVEIIHTMKFRWPWLAWFAEPIIGNFIHNIAGKTLSTFKEIIEKEERKRAFKS
jgi:ribosome-associated toxin RatA of RatAB toxin-antitoxin module